MELVARLLLTYLVHSTLLLAAAWAVCRALGERRLSLQEALVRAALVGGFATAALQVGLGLVPLGGALRLPQPAVAAPGPAEAVSVSVSGAAPVSVPSVLDARREGSARSLAPATAASAGTSLAAAAGSWITGFVVVPAEPTWAERAALAARPAAGYWREALTLAWALLVSAALTRLVVAARRLSLLLRGRTTLASSPLAPEAEAVGEALGLRPPVRISTAPRLTVPLATGVLRPEVCLPTRAVVDLGPEEQVALCAHELAHVARRDPAWVLAARVAESLAPLQPLNCWARRHLQDLAECLSDDLAVAVSARPLGLARSLVDVASWTLDDPALLPAAAAGALSARSRLGIRVERLMDPVRRLERPRRLLLPAAAVAVLATALVTPVVSGSATVSPAPSAPATPAPAPRPAPAARPAPQARPAPAARPAPEPQPAPEAKGTPVARRDAESAREAEARLEELSRQIAERARGHEAEMEKLQAELAAAAARVRPSEAELQRLSSEMEKAAQELATAVAAQVQDGREQASGDTRDAARRMAALQDELRRNAATIRVPAEEMRALSERARALADQARPTAAELAEIHRLSRELARQSAPDAQALADMARGEADRALSQARQMSDETREAIHRAAEEMRRGMDEMRRALDEMRRESLAGPGRRSPVPESRPETPKAKPAPQP